MADQPQSKRQLAAQRKSALVNDRSAWMPMWQDISLHQQPRCGRFLVSKTTAPPEFNRIYDNTAVSASRTLAAGMMSFATSPARPWFRLTLTDRDLVERPAVKTWLHRTGVLLREVFARSNTYRALHQGYEELGLFGTWATLITGDFNTVIHHHPMTIGEFSLSTDDKGRVDTFCREFQMTVGQMVQRFGRNNCSQSVRNLWDRHNLDARVTVSHLIEPRKERDQTLRDSRNMAWADLYFEPAKDNIDELLAESGHKRFPVLAPRWQVTGSDVYGTSPGMEAQGDVRQLQFEQLRKGQAIDYQVNPPLAVPLEYKDQGSSRLPGGIMYVGSGGPNAGIRSAFEVNLNLQHLLGDIEDVRQRIKGAYYADMFLMMANDMREGMTATEVAQRQEEKLLMLGPVTERLDNELNTPLIDIAFDYCDEAGILPPIPPELEGVAINVEYISVLAQAQRAVSAQGMDRLLGTIGNLAALRPEVADKIDFDQAVDDYADMYGVNPEIVVSDDDVAAIRDDRAKQLQAQQMAAAAPVAVDAAHTASQIDPTAMRDVMDMFSGYGSQAA
jgi:hypothetical protein